MSQAGRHSNRVNVLAGHLAPDEGAPALARGLGLGRSRAQSAHLEAPRPHLPVSGPSHCALAGYTQDALVRELTLATEAAGSTPEFPDAQNTTVFPPAASVAR